MRTVFPVSNLGVIYERPLTPSKPVYPMPGPSTLEDLEDDLADWVKYCRQSKETPETGGFFEKVATPPYYLEELLIQKADRLGYDLRFDYELCIPRLTLRSLAPIRYDWSAQATPISQEAVQRASMVVSRPRIPTIPFGGLFQGSMAYTGPVS